MAQTYLHIDLEKRPYLTETPKYYLINFFKIVAITWVIVWLFFYRNLDNLNVNWHCFLNAFMTGVFWTGCNMIADLSDRYYDWFNHTKRKLAFISLTTILFVSSVFTLIIMFWNFPTNGINPGILKQLSFSDYRTVLLITAILSLIIYGRGFLLAWKDAALEAESLKKEQAEARFQTLKHQTNPHFLFNSLNVLTTLVHKDANQAEEFVRKLSSVYRYVLENREHEVVPIQTELKAIKAYDHLMKIRFGDGYQLEIDIEDMNQVIPPLTLQLLIENALKHNIASKKKPLHIRITEREQRLFVENNIQLVNLIKDSTGIGLKNIIDRYQYLNEHPVEVHETEALFTVSLPVLHTQN